MLEPIQKSFGQQPLDSVLTINNISSQDLVEKSTEQLTFKQIQKGRAGKKISRNIQFKILNSLNQLTQDKQTFQLKDLFNY